MLLCAVLGSLATAVALIAGGSVFWAVLPFPKVVLHGVPNEALPALHTLDEKLPGSGAYCFPLPPGDASSLLRKGSHALQPRDFRGITYRH